MDRRDEDDFAGFVRGRSDPLFRTAYLLTGDHRRAEDLLRDALAAVYRRWPRLSSANRAEVQARTVLVHRATSRRRGRVPPQLPAPPPVEPADPEYDERVAASCRVWNAVLRLPRRQRAVLVLRHYDDLGEAETAEVLETSLGAVQGDVRAAGERLATLPSGAGGRGPGARGLDGRRVAEALRVAAGDVASTVTAPGVDPDEVRARARARRAAGRRRLLGGAGLAALVVAGLVVVVDRGGRPGPAPAPAPTRLEAPRNAAVWADARGIHVGRRTYLPVRRPTSLTLLRDAVVYQDRRAGLWLQPLDGTEPVRIGTSWQGSSPLGQPDGATVAWIEHVPGDGTGDHLVVYDTARDRELARTGVAGGGAVEHTLTGGDRVTNAGPFLYVDRHQVVLHPALGTYRLDVATGKATRLAGEEPRPAAETLPGATMLTVDAVPGLRVVALCCGDDHRYQRPAALVDDAGRLRDYLGLLEPSGLFDHDWRRYATVVGTSRLGHRVAVVDVDSGRVRALTPETRFFTLLGWGYGDVLMVHEFDIGVRGESGPPRLLRCRVSAGACAPLDLAPMNGATGRAVLLPTS